MTKRKVIRIILLIITILFNVYIIMNSCMNGVTSTSSSSWVINMFKAICNAFVPGSINDSNIGVFTNVIRKLVGHFGLCLIDGVLTTITTYFYIKKNEYLKLTLISLNFGLFISILTEKIQLFIPGRAGDGLDSFIDFSGFLLGFLIILLIIYLINRHSEKKLLKANNS